MAKDKLGHGSESSEYAAHKAAHNNQIILNIHRAQSMKLIPKDQLIHKPKSKNQMILEKIRSK